MAEMKSLDQHLQRRGGRWHYIRRIPARFRKLDGRGTKAHVAAQAGRLIEGTVAQKFELTHGPHAMIETQRAFYLVPWENHHAQKWGERIKGRVLGGGGIDWDVGRSIGIGR